MRKTKKEITTQEEWFANEMCLYPDDHSIRLVFADYLQTERGWSDERVKILRDGRLTGKQPYRPVSNPYHTWGDYATEDGDDRSNLPIEVYELLPLRTRQPVFEIGVSAGRWLLYCGVNNGLDSAWREYRQAIVAWATSIEKERSDAKEGEAKG